jgi:hypothetical protein
MTRAFRANRSLLRWAVLASVGLHLVLAVAILLTVRSRPVPVAATAPPIDTGGDVVVRVFEAGPATEIDLPVTPEPRPAERDPPVVPPASPPPATAALPRVHALPLRSLPAEALAIISRTAAAPGHNAGVTAIHGALEPGRRIVYVLDTSGSMGEHGKLALAASALLATIRSQPESVRFQVIAYNSAACPLLANGDCVPATPANASVAGERIRQLESKGTSRHHEAIRLAARFRPDTIVLLTDAEGLTLAQFRPILAAAEKPPYITVSRVTPGSIGRPSELR